MYAARAAKPKLSLSISAATNTTRPALSLRSPGPVPRTPISPSPLSPVCMREFSKQSAPMYSYTNSSTAKSILKKGSTSSTSSRSSGKSIQFQSTPTVYCVTPIENKDEYYGGQVKVSRDERRWGARSWGNFNRNYKFTNKNNDLIFLQPRRLIWKRLETPIRF
jgi:hypothetical protein